MAKKLEYKQLFLLFLLSLAFLLVFSDDTSPFAKYWYGSDSSLYMLFGKAISDGLLPYRDIFDHKGPYFFFLQFIGNLIWRGKTGVFILQVINITICLYFSVQIFKLENKWIDNKYRNLLVLPVLWVLAGTLEGGDTNEEFSLAFSIISLYISIKYIKKCNDGHYYFNHWYGFLFGIFFGFIAFSRINNSGFLCAMVLCVTIELLAHKEYKCLGLNFLCFFMGFAVVTFPMMFYYAIHDYLSEMLYSSFVFAFQYATNTPFIVKIKEYVFSITFLYILPIFIPIIVMIMHRQIKTKEFLFLCISTFSTIVATFVGYNYPHYYILTVPNVVFSIYILLKEKNFIVNNSRRKIIFALMTILLLSQSYRVAIDFGNSLVHSIDVNVTYRKFGYYEYFTNESIDIVNQIPDDEKDSIWGHGIASRFYMRTGIYPCIKYYDYVDMYFEENLGEVKTQIMNMLNSNKPKWIITAKKEATIPYEIADFISNNYVLYYENEEFKLFNYVR